MGSGGPTLKLHTLELHTEAALSLSGKPTMEVNKAVILKEWQPLDQESIRDNCMANSQRRKLLQLGCPRQDYAAQSQQPTGHTLPGLQPHPQRCHRRRHRNHLHLCVPSQPAEEGAAEPSTYV